MHQPSARAFAQLPSVRRARTRARCSGSLGAPKLRAYGTRLGHPWARIPLDPQASSAGGAHAHVPVRTCAYT
eukprot:CAMPEP_0174716898 /NCGR_PEP_ID=MMETSP1094-20130205/25131_1 /TAXON_ID=156173 /ORGANISM="Chrysochromulina brevifilum, Strain UTEX LB 985" /LENGTH=71 /DNA_ID=CAMNT_0015916757 /DNA_START=211 /DNA_END=423 /DNA_ORIENTATION=+